MNIKRAKEEIEHTVKAYLAKDALGEYAIPAIRQRPILLMGPPGIGKTQVMEQVARELSLIHILTTSGSFNVLGNDGRCSIIGKEIGFENIGVDANIDTSTHGNEASFEFIVDKNPDYIFAMDRDAAIGTDGAQMAQEILENELVKSTDAYKKGHVVYLRCV